jgi:hypothetical protein
MAPVGLGKSLVKIARQQLFTLKIFTLKKRRTSIGTRFRQAEVRCLEAKALFVEQSAPTFLVLGIHNKIVKLRGSEGV